MNDLEVLRYQMLIRVEVFGTTYAAYFEPTSIGSKLFATVAAVVAELNTHATAQESGNSDAQQSTTAKAFIRKELREALTAISRTAFSISMQKPGIKDKFSTSNVRNDQLLLGTARTFADFAAPIADDFVKYEMPADFLEELNAKIELFEKAVRDQNKAIGARVSATAGIEGEIERGLKSVKQLDAIVRNKFNKEPGILAAWISASHREKVARSVAAKKSVD